MIQRSLIAAMLAFAVAACTRTAPTTAPPAPGLAPAPAAVAPASAPTSAPASAAAHHHGQPSIDCPLHQAGGPAHQGGHPHGDLHRPFGGDVHKYITHLDRADRDAWQKPDALIAALGLKGGETVADVGAGSGYFTFRFAKALPRGKVVALDIEPEMIRHIHHRAMTEGVKNVTAVLSKPDDPGVPPGADLVFLADVLHHVDARDAWLVKLFGQMKPGAKLVLVEFKEGKLPQGPPEAMKIPLPTLEKIVGAAGLALDAEKPGLLPYQHVVVFHKP
jgi:SAM-dependent methyltransferase